VSDPVQTPESVPLRRGAVWVLLLASVALLFAVIGSHVRHQQVDAEIFDERERYVAYSHVLSEVGNHLAEARDAERSFFGSVKRIDTARARYDGGQAAVDRSLEALGRRFQRYPDAKLTTQLAAVGFAVEKYQSSVDDLMPIVRKLGSADNGLLLTGILAILQRREAELQRAYSSEEDAESLLRMQRLSREFVITLHMERLDELIEQLDLLAVHTPQQSAAVAGYRADLDQLLTIALGLDLQKADSQLQYQRAVDAIEGMEQTLKTRRVVRSVELGQERQQHRLRQRTLLVLLAFTLFSCLYAQGLARRRLLARIERLAAAMNNFQTGAAPAFVVDGPTRTPLGQLSQQFLRMAEQINEQFRQLLKAQKQRIEQESREAVLREREMAAALLAQRELWFRTIFENAHDMMMIVNEERYIVDINLSGQRLLTRAPEDICGARLLAMFAPDSHEVIRDALESGSAQPVEVGLTSSAQPPPRVRLRVSKVRIDDRPFFHLIGQDISRLVEATREQERLAQRLRKAEQFELLGTLAGGIAHDVNNLLTPILGCAELLESATVGDAEAEALRQDILLSGKQAADLVRQILRVGRTSARDTTYVALGSSIRLGTRPIQRRLPPGVFLEVPPIDNSIGVLATESEVQQIVSNLCSNSMDAMPGGGIVRITVKRLAHHEAPLMVQTEMKRQPLVRLRVHDDGDGMPPEVMDRIFEPYFSTKPLQRGTGLGLATVFAIVQRFGGSIVPSSVPGAGTTIDVYLPLAVRPELAAPTAPAPMPTIAAGTRIVVLDDEPLNVRLVKRMLRSRDAVITGFSDSGRALDYLLENHQDYDLVLSDLHMPDPDGFEVLQQLSALCPGLPVVIFTGHGEANIRARALADGARAVLLKPLRTEELVEAIARTLEADGTARVDGSLDPYG